MADGVLAAVTMGDPWGAGPELVLKARRRDDAPPFLWIGCARTLKRRARLFNLDVPMLEVASTDEALDAVADDKRVLPILDHPLDRDVDVGRRDLALASAVADSVREATRIALERRDVHVVTSPSAKSVLASAGIPHRGHTRWIAELVDERLGLAEPTRPLMLMTWTSSRTDDRLRVAPLSDHVPLSEAAGFVTEDAVLRAIRLLDDELRRRFGVASPRLAVAGLNPHAGDEGLLGDEEERIVVPALDALRREGIDVEGPLSADSLFVSSRRRRFDAILCMYHDQALIPIKTLADGEAVNATLGLPIVRTSPAHGPAEDIAASGIADPSSLVAALREGRRLLLADRRSET